MPKKQPAKKRAYKKRVKQDVKKEFHWVKSEPKTIGQLLDQAANEPKININAEYIRDELDLLRDMFASFESLNEEARARAYAYFTNKYSRYGIANF